MSSELVKKLELAKINTSFIDYGHDGATWIKHDNYNSGLIDAIDIVKSHEAQQMKEPFYKLDEEQQNLLNDMKTSFNDGEAVEIIFEMVFEEYDERLTTLKLIQVFNAFTTWAIEQEKLEEEK